MRVPSVVLIGLFGLAAFPSGQASLSPGAEAKVRKVLAEPHWAASPPIPEPFEPPSQDDDALPAPSIQEPFAIGEAMYEESRAPDAIVSLLAKMRIPIVAPAAGASSAKGLQVDHDEVRALIDLAVHDLQHADGLENLPYSFADLHAAVVPLLPQMTVEALAAAYQQAYEGRPDDLVPRVMMGQPIEPETRLTRAQIWLLLMDGFAAPDGETAWGTADRAMPDVPSPVAGWSRAEWREVIARLPLVPARRLLASDSAADRVSVRLEPQGPALVSRISGRTLIAAKPGSLAGGSVTWTVDEQERLDELATVSTPLGQPVSIGANGVALLTYKGVPDPTGGRGELVREWIPVTASLPACPLISGALAVPGPLCAQLIGDRRASIDALFTWRTSDKIWLRIENHYSLRLQFSGLGSVTRWGTDSAQGTLVRGANGRYVGEMKAKSDSTQTLIGSGQCKNGQEVTEQTLVVEGSKLLTAEEPKTGIASIIQATKSRELYLWIKSLRPITFGTNWVAEPPDQGYLGLEFFPGKPAKVTGGTPDPCRDFIRATTHRRFSRRTFLPLNDAQWTTAGGRYPIGLRTSSDYAFVDANAFFEFFVEPDAAGDKFAPMWVVRVRRLSQAKP